MKQKKELGQNFLTNKKVIQEFIDFCEPNNKDVLLEIGIGTGNLTKYIAPKVEKVIGIEVDKEAIQQIRKLKIESLKIINEDFLDLNLSEVVRKHKINKIIGAIPYYISSPIIHKIMKESNSPLKKVYLITQKEFAEKVVGSNNIKIPQTNVEQQKEIHRSYFTNLIERYGKIKKGKKIDKSSFTPSPKVNSMCFGWKFTSYPQNEKEVENWSKFAHYVFKTPRKKINKRFNKDILEKAGVNPNLRPENLTLEQVKQLWNSHK